jgi:ABC-type bacteriocin/lantibiotic exporter with double-glycine peptidase domain
LKKIIEIFKILEKKNLLLIILILIFGIFAVILELLSVFNIYPILLQFNVNPQDIENVFIKDLVNYYNINFTNINYLIFFFLIFFIIKNIYLFFYNYFILLFSNRIYLLISNKIFFAKIKKNYLDFNNLSSSNFYRDTKDLTAQFRVYVETLFSLLIELLVFLSFLIFLFIINFKVTAYIFFSLLILLFIYSYFFKKYLILLGEKKNFFLEKLNEIIFGSYRSIIDIKIYNKEIFFFNHFKNENKIYSKFHLFSVLIFSSIKNYIEIIVSLLLFFLYFFYYKGENLLNDLPIIGIYFLSAYRLLPAFSRIMIYKMQLAHYSNTVFLIQKILIDSLKPVKYLKKDKKFIHKSLEFKNVNFFYKKDKLILKNINLLIKKNSIIGITGPSGGGKSTLVRLAMGLISPTSGNILFDENFDIVKNKDLFDLNIAYVSQNFFVLRDSIKNNICFGNEEKNNFHENKINTAIKISKFDEVMKSNNLNLQSIITEDALTLSGGQRQRLAIARALYFDSDILVLDEATNSLDLKTANKILSNIFKLKKITILVSHEKHILNLCERIFFVNNNSIKEIK